MFKNKNFQYEAIIPWQKERSILRSFQRSSVLNLSRVKIQISQDSISAAKVGSFPEQNGLARHDSVHSCKESRDINGGSRRMKAGSTSWSQDTTTMMETTASAIIVADFDMEQSEAAEG